MKIYCAQSSETISDQIADLLETESWAAIRSHGRFTVAFSGGSLPKIVADGLLKRQLPFDKWHIYFADERCVPIDHQDSNYKLVHDVFISRANPRPIAYHIEPALIKDPEACASAYQRTLQETLPLSIKESTPKFKGHKFDVSGVPVFDMVLLGMGPDGHTCSLFPSHKLLKEHGKYVAAIHDSPKMPPARITLTLPVLYQAQNVIFVATGSSKKEILPYIVGNKIENGPDEKFPSRMVQNRNEIIWFIDEEAAEDLDKATMEHLSSGISKL